MHLHGLVQNRIVFPMKANKVLLIIQASLMYAMHLPFYIMLIALYAPLEESLKNLIISKSFMIGCILIPVIFPVCIVTAIMALISLFKGGENPSKVTMIVKLALIPWYILNFQLCVMLLAGFLNPWLLFAAPLMAAILICSTYCFMLATSLPDITFFFHKLIKRETKIRAPFVVSIVFMFIFCLDIIGGIIFYINAKEL